MDNVKINIPNGQNRLQSKSSEIKFSTTPTKWSIQLFGWLQILCH